MTSPGIELLIRRAKAGDADAMSTLYETYVQAIYRYVFYRVPTAADAEDITAEVFLKVVEGLATYQITDVPFEAWLYRIAAARIADFHRRRRVRPQAALSETMVDDTLLPEEQVQKEQEFELIRQMLQHFNDEEQTLLLLRFVERKSHQEVAIILGRSVGAVKTAQYRILMQLASLFGQEKVRHYLRGNNG
jgi:RNA polymerase sigma-70 factor, ECF subfamily